MLNELLCDENGKVHIFEVFMALLTLLIALSGVVLFALAIGFSDSRFSNAGVFCFLFIWVIAFFGKRGAYRSDT